MTQPKHPVQPVITDEHGTYRFKQNAIVRALLDAGRHGQKMDLNILAEMDFPREDRVQFAQLIGYSVSGFGDLSYVSDRDYAKAQTQIRKMKKETGGCG